MKSYLRFLSRNKLYTAIEVVGLSLALAFLIILGSILIDKSQVNDNIKDKDKIYSLVWQREEPLIGQVGRVGKELAELPMVKEWVRFDVPMETTLSNEKGTRLVVTRLSVTPNYFRFFQIPMLIGDAGQVLQNKDGAVLSRRLAEKLFPDTDPTGQIIKVHNWWEETPSVYTVTGVLDDPGKCVLPDADMYINHNEPPQHRNNFMFKPVSKGDIDDILRFFKTYDAKSEINNEIFHSTEIIPFDETKDGKVKCPFFRHISDPKTHSAFMLTCIVILIFSILNYISLTLAFSRFRMKEVATRTLLGSSSISIIVRCLAESFILVGCSCLIAIMLILIFQNGITSFFNVDIKPLESYAIIIAMVLIVTVTALISGAINALMNHRHRPIDIIKGESRFKDKSIIGKIFIGIQSAVCLSAVITGAVIMLQTSKMTSHPVGFETDNIISVCSLDKSFKDCMGEIREMPFVENTGYAVNDFTLHAYSQSLEKGIEWCYLLCNQDAFDILGFKVKEYLDTGLTSSISYTNERGLTMSRSLTEVDWSNKFIGVVEDFHFGSLKDISKENTIFEISIRDDIEMLANHMLIKVSGNPYDALNRIRDHFIEKGVYHDTMEIHVLKDRILMNYKDEHKMMRLVSVFSIICILLTALAIVALSGYYAQMRTHDTAVRKVFGISRVQVFWNTVWGFISPIIIGAAVAIPVIWAYTSRWLENYALRIDNSPIIYLGALAAVLLITTASVAIQALRLTRTNPAEALKKE